MRLMGLLCVEETAGHFPRPTLFSPCAIAGGQFCRVQIRLPKGSSPARQRRIVRRAARRLYTWGIRQVISPAGPFAHWEVLEECFLRRVSVQPFLAHFADQIALFWMEAEGRPRRKEVVVLQGGRMQGIISRTAESLCQKVRNVVVQVPGSEALKERLQVQYGLPALPGVAGYEQAGLVLLFSPARQGETTVPGAGAVFSLCPLPVLLQTERKQLSRVFFRLKSGGSLPGQWDQMELLSALWEMGCLSLGEVEIIQLA